MLVGIPKEIKNQEFRVGLLPSSVRELVLHGHKVLVEKNAGLGVGFDDECYQNAGAVVLDKAAEIYEQAELIVKVKEPQLSECKLLRKNQLLFTFLHLAPDPEQAKALLASKCIAIAYETVTDFKGGLPLLAPMSEVAGRMAVQAGASHLEKARGGKGILLGGVPGVKAANVVILGGGVVGSNALKIAVGMGANVTVLDKSLTVIRRLDDLYGTKIQTIYATADALEEYVLCADLVIGAVLVPGSSAPKLVTKPMLKKMQSGTVMVDVSIDQGGCFETSIPTTHSQPTYVVDGIVHYCVTNMPGGAPLTSNFALNNATLPFVMALAKKGFTKALLQDEHLLNGLNVFDGKITHQAVAEALGYEYYNPKQLF